MSTTSAESGSNYDLFALRCAAAALLWARLHILEITPIEIVRADHAITTLKRQQPDLVGELAATIAALLSPEHDADGVRTVTAVDRLAQLVNVDLDTVAALAASLIPAPQNPAQLELFSLSN